MTNFYQGSIRIKDFLPFLKTQFQEHGWEIVDEDMTTASWFVMQKLALGGGVMTFAFRDLNYPNYGHIMMIPSVSTEMTQDSNNVYISGYDPITQTLTRTPYTYNYSYRAINIATHDGNRTPVYYYFNPSLADTEVTPIYLFYKLHIENDFFVISMEGNPATTGHGRNIMYGGAFEKTISELPTNNAVGLWGYSESNFAGLILSRVDETPTKWYNVSSQHFLDNTPSVDIEKHLTTPIYTNYNHPSYPLVTIPKDFALYTPVQSTLIDGNNFVAIGASKYIYYRIGGASRASFVKVLEGVSDVSLKDNGTGYELSWTNPNNVDLSKVAIYARLDDYPEDENDVNAILIYENNAPINGGIGTYIDTDIARYGNIVHYAVLVFDNAIPDANVSLVNSVSTVKATGLVIENFINLPFKNHISMPNYKSSNVFAIAPYFKPDLMMPLNENVADTVVTDLLGNYTGVASANTDTMSVAGQTGNALDFNTNKFITLAPALKMEGNFSFQFWYKDMDNTNTSTRPIIGTTGSGDGSFELDNSYGFNFYRNRYPQNYQHSTFTPDMSFHFVTYARSGNTGTIYIDGEMTKDMGAIADIGSFNLLELVTMIGRRSDVYSNLIIENFEKFDFAVSELQHKMTYNAGVGRPLDVNDYIDGFATVISENAMILNNPTNHSISVSFPVKNITNKSNINFEVYSEEAGIGIFFVTIKGAGIPVTKVIDIAVEKTWESHTIDITGLSDEFKKNINFISIEAGTVSKTIIVSVRNFTAS